MSTAAETVPSTPPPPVLPDEAVYQRLQAGRERVAAELSKVIVGQREVVEQLLVALLEAMQEHQVTAAGVRHVLAEPFFVLATQNPIEMEGTYPLPEAQLDRFLFNVLIDYLPEADEVAVVQQTTGRTPQRIDPVF